MQILRSLPVVIVVLAVAVRVALLHVDRATAQPGGSADAVVELDPPSDDLLQRAKAALRGPLPAAMPGAHEDSPELVSLGRKLYFERGLSVNGAQSCNDCHRLDDGLAGVDNQATSLGALGQRGTRNAPTVLNAGFHMAQFWDGRAAHLAEQAMGPPLNPIEMAMGDDAAIVGRLGELGYERDFRAAFPSQDQPLSFANAAAAIAAFERTLISRSRFDDYLAGDQLALSIHEKQGLELFVSSGCAYCHGGPTLGGTMYQKVGLFEPYANQADLGRYTLTNQDSDRFVFKVPALRNVSLTAPYFHDGNVPDLAQAVDHMGRMQLNRKLEKAQIDALTAFLAALSDPQRRALASADSVTGPATVP